MIFKWLTIFGFIVLFSCRSLVNTFDDIEDALYFESSNIVDSDFHDSLKVMTWNIRFGAGRIAYFGDSCGDRSLMIEDETIENLDKIVEYIEESKPDIILFQEIDLSSKRSAYLNQIQYILDSTYFNYASYASNWDVNYVPSDGIGKVNMGNAIFSRWKIKDAQRIKLALRTDQPSYVRYGYLRRNILKAKIDLPNYDKDIYTVNIHATAFATDDTKQKHIDKYKSVLDEIDELGEDFITGGDLNSLPPNAQKIDFCEIDQCEGENLDDMEGCRFNNFEGEPDLLKPLYNSYFPAIDTSLVNNHEHLTHSTWNDTYSDLEADSWDRKLDYLFTNYQNWTSTGKTDNTILKTSDHAPVTAILYFNQ